MKTVAPHTKQQKSEQRAFIQFIERLGTRCEWVSIESRPVPEPDLLCVRTEGDSIAFELVSLTDPVIAEKLAIGPEAFQEAFSTPDPSERIIKNKLQKKYQTNAPHIELLVYTDKQLITPDDVIIPTIQPLFDTIPHKFERIWFMGEFKTGCLWNARNSSKNPTDSHP